MQWLFVAEFGWDVAARYAAFLQNLLMSKTRLRPGAGIPTGYLSGS